LIVVDASALIEVLLRTPAASSVEAHLFAPGQTLHAPHLLDIEVAQVIRRYAAKGEIDGERGRGALTDLCDLPMQRYPHDLLLPRVWERRGVCGPGRGVGRRAAHPRPAAGFRSGASGADRSGLNARPRHPSSCQAN
jgi:hypothetical protein